MTGARIMILLCWSVKSLSELFQQSFIEHYDLLLLVLFDGLRV